MEASVTSPLMEKRTIAAQVRRETDASKSSVWHMSGAAPGQKEFST